MMRPLRASGMSTCPRDQPPAPARPLEREGFPPTLSVRLSPRGWDLPSHGASSWNTQVLCTRQVQRQRLCAHVTSRTQASLPNCPKGSLRRLLAAFLPGGWDFGKGPVPSFPEAFRGSAHLPSQHRAHGLSGHPAPPSAYPQGLAVIKTEVSCLCAGMVPGLM